MSDCKQTAAEPRTPAKTWDVRLIARSYFSGTVVAPSHHAAVEETYRIWREDCPHPFESCDDSELIDVVAEEVTA